MKNALSGNPHRVLMKLITQGKKETVIGIHMVGDYSGEIIQALGICVKAGLTKRISMRPARSIRRLQKKL